MNTIDIARRSASETFSDPSGKAGVLDALPTPVWCSDAAGACTFVNQAWQDYTGRSVRSEMGEGWLASMHPEDRPALERAWREALGLRRPLKIEYRLLRADGAYGWLHHAAVPVLDESGRLTGYLATCHDITVQRAAELTAIAREQQIRMLADNVPVHIAYYAASDLRCLFANKGYARMWRWDEHTILGRTVEEVIGAEGFASVAPHIERVRRGEAVVYEREVQLPDGAARVLEVSLLPQLAANGETLAAVVLIHDITRHRRAEQAVRESEERLRKFAEAAQAGVVFHDEGVITDVNEAILRLTGYTAQQMIGSHVIEYIAPERRAEAVENVRRGYERPYESEIIAADGSRIAVEFEGREMPFQGKVYRLSIVRDIRRRKANQARIDYLAHHDLLTGLPNRALLQDRLEFIVGSARRRGSQAALLFIDLDNFKVVNDSLGHDAGDMLLKVLAERIPQVLRSVDVVCRHGGDEFIVVLPDLENDDGCVAVAEKLLATISEPMTIEGQVVSVSPSIGISLFPRDGRSPSELIRNADAAMYLAKERGRNNYQFFNEGLSEAARRAFTLEGGMREALRDEAFILHYQPQVRVDTGAVTGLEALIRWPQPSGGFIEPNEFIPVAEQRGLIRAIGSWVLKSACRQNREWQLAGVPIVPVAVNLSAVQFRQKDFVAEVEAVLAETGLEPRYLAFELTESMLMADSDEMARILERLKALGVGLAIDDFGTGHSSLMHLKRFPIDKLKIDRTFVRDTPGDADDVAITAAIIDLARNLGITSIAEGVDRLDQLELLRSRGCVEAQGYLFARAMPASQVATWLSRPHSGTVTRMQGLQT
ncbi:MAG TPA: EAL domain-containing protein [Usitatibacter sp.]|nr:EAL domain-containing protein [Usitatibacter sp.]